jgi:hypothetical protein
MPYAPSGSKKKKKKKRKKRRKRRKKKRKRKKRNRKKRKRKNLYKDDVLSDTIVDFLNIRASIRFIALLCVVYGYVYIPHLLRE